MQTAPTKQNKKRVTLTLDPGVHEEAVRIAKIRGLSFSGLVEDLLAEQREDTAEEWVQRLMSHAVDYVPPPPGEDARYDHYETKYYPEQARAEGRDRTPQPGGPGDPGFTERPREERAA